MFLKWSTVDNTAYSRFGWHFAVSQIMNPHLRQTLKKQNKTKQKREKKKKQDAESKKSNLTSL